MIILNISYLEAIGLKKIRHIVHKVHIVTLMKQFDLIVNCCWDFIHFVIVCILPSIFVIVTQISSYVTKVRIMILMKRFDLIVNGCWDFIQFVIVRILP